MEAVDTFVPQPKRAIAASVPDADRGHLLDLGPRQPWSRGRIERGKVKVGEDCEIVGFRETRKTVCTGVEMFKKQLDEGLAGDQRRSFFCAASRRKMWSAAWCWRSRDRLRPHRVQGRDLTF